MNTDEVKNLLEKAKQSIKAAQLLWNDQFYDFASSRCYYAMFYGAEALLLFHNHSFSKHSGVISAFGKLFVKTGILDSKYHRFLLEAFDLRNMGYFPQTGISSHEKTPVQIIKSKNLAQLFFPIFLYI